MILLFVNFLKGYLQGVNTYLKVLSFFEVFTIPALGDISFSEIVSFKFLISEIRFDVNLVNSPF